MSIDEEPIDSQPVQVAVSLLLFISQMFFQEVSEIISDKIFDSLHVLSAPKKDALADELTQYLAAPTEAAPDPLLWWIERQAVYPRLSRMAHKYLCIPGTGFFLISNT